MANVGEAVIRIIGDSSAFDRTLDNLGRTTGRALERGSRGLLDRANDLGAEFGQRIGASASRWLRRGLVVAAAGVAAAVGAVIVKGFRRFTTLEDATASLTLQLGSATKAAGLLNDVLTVVEGTPFALDQFVDAARNLVAASIPLEKVPRILQAIADGAAAAGGSAQDVDDVVNAIARLATGAELTLGPIRDLEEQGVPALRILANQAGKSTREMAKDITAGTVDSQKAIDDLVEGLINGTDGINGATVAFGGAAKEVGNTVAGAYSNMQIAISRAGAKVIAVFAETGEKGGAIVAILNSLRETVDVLGDAAVRMARKFVGSDGMGKVLDFFEKLPGRVEDATASLGEKGGFRKALLSFFDATDFSDLTSKILDGIRRAFETLPAEQIGAVFSTIIVKGIEATAEFTPVIVAAIVRAAPVIIRGIVEGLLRAARDNPLDMGLFLVALGIPGVAPALAGFFRALPFGAMIAPLISGLGRAITAGMRAIGLTSAFSILGDKIALGVVGLVLRVAAAGSAVAASIAVALGVALGVLLHNLIERFFPEINRALEEFGGDVYDFFADLPEKITSALEDLGGLMYDIGANALTSLRDGAVSILTDSAWANFWEGVGGFIVDKVGGALEEGSPSKVFMRMGRGIVDGLRLGVEQRKPTLDRVLANLVPTGSYDLSAAIRGGLVPAMAGSTTHNWTINEAGSADTTVERIIARLATG